MNLSSRAVYGLVFIICMNSICTVFYYMGIRGTMITPAVEGSHFVNATDLTDPLQTYDYSQPYSDFPFGVLNFVNIVLDIIVTGYPRMLLSFGLPAEITTALVLPYMLIWFLVILLNWIGGRDV